MPIIKSAKKKMRQDMYRTERNKQTIKAMKQTVRLARMDPSSKNLTLAFAALDQATKKSVIHKNKASRLKARLSKQVKGQKSKAQVKSSK